MPELPEVEAVCRRLREEAAGEKIVKLEILRPSITKPQNPEAIEAACHNTNLKQVERRGKNILLHLANGAVIHIHLRMTGNLYLIPDRRLLTSAVRAVFHLRGHKGIVFYDPRALGTLRLATDSLPEPGIDPLTPNFTPALFQSLAKKSRKPAKLFLMDQDKLSGLGNIYAAEALFRAGIDPRKSIGQLSSRRLTALHAAIVGVLKDAVHSAYLSYSDPGHMLAAEEESLMVYGRAGEPCRTCGRIIRRMIQGGRSTFYCAECQT